MRRPEREPVLAKHPGRCGLCDAPIIADQHLIVLVDDEWCHDDCADGEV